MSFSSKSLARAVQVPVGSTAGAANANMASLLFYATDDAAATVETDGYFNSARALLFDGDVIIGSCVVSGTNVSKVWMVKTSPTSGNVTIGMGSVTAG